MDKQGKSRERSFSDHGNASFFHSAQQSVYGMLEGGRAPRNQIGSPGRLGFRHKGGQ